MSERKYPVTLGPWNIQEIDTDRRVSDGYGAISCEAHSHNLAITTGDKDVMKAATEFNRDLLSGSRNVHASAGRLLAELNALIDKVMQ